MGYKETARYQGRWCLSQELMVYHKSSSLLKYNWRQSSTILSKQSVPRLSNIIYISKFKSNINPIMSQTPPAAKGAETRHVEASAPKTSSIPIQVGFHCSIVAYFQVGNARTDWLTSSRNLHNGLTIRNSVPPPIPTENKSNQFLVPLIDGFGSHVLRGLGHLAKLHPLRFGLSGP